MASEPIIGLFRIRVVKTFNAGNAEVTNNLPHLRQTHIDIAGFQPGNPGSSTLGSFSVKLHPPGTEGYAAAKAIYDQLDYFNRLEFYISTDGASLGKLYYAGIVTSIRKSHGANSTFELTGQSDLVLANLSRPFPGELLPSDVTSAILQSYLGTNELGLGDAFNPFTSGNYTSSNTPGFTAGAWAGTTDDGFNVVSISSGTGPCLINKTGAAANDRWHSHYVEVTGRLAPSADTANAGAVGIGLGNSNSSISSAVVGKVTAYKAGSRYNLNAIIATFGGGVLTSSNPLGNVLLNVDDPNGFIPLTIGLLVNIGQGGSYAALTVNGKVVITYTPTGYDPGTTTNYPFLHYVPAATGTATAYLTNFIQMTRFTTDGPSTAATFGNGTISTATNSLSPAVDPGPTFLEVWSRLATREGWYWRYTPQPYVVGTRTLGTIDYGAGI